MPFRQKRFFLFIGVIIFLFLTAWIFLASHLSAWSDEVSHLATGKSLSLVGKPMGRDFDAGLMTHQPYYRGWLISYGAKLAYDMTGDEGYLFAARFLPLLFSLLIFAAFIFYLQKKHKASGMGEDKAAGRRATQAYLSSTSRSPTTENAVFPHNRGLTKKQNVSLETIWVAAILFFSQSLVLEKSLYVRFYPPLALFTLLSLITYWEGFENFKQKKILRMSVLWMCSLLCITIPILDGWHVQQVSIFLLGVILSFCMRFKMLPFYIQKYRFKIVAYFIVILFLAPFITMIIDEVSVISRLGIRLGTAIWPKWFLTYWDNLVGLFRFLWATNICFWGTMVVLSTNGFQKTFHVWLCGTGLLSGLLMGLFCPHNFIFYSRFFYIPVILIILGFSELFVSWKKEVFQRRIFLSVYIALNFLLSFTTFYYDRSNIYKPIYWLTQNIKKNDFLIVSGAELELHGGNSLLSRVYSLNVTQDPGDILNHILKDDKIRDIYFLYTYHYQWRDYLYKKTMGIGREPSQSLFWYLKSEIPSQSIFSNLRGCGLIRFNKEDVIRKIQEVVVQGYPKLQYRDIGIHKRMARRMLNVFGFYP